MLTFLSLFFFIFIFFHGEFIYPFFLLSLFLFFIIRNSFSFNFSYSFNIIIRDELSLFIVYMTLFVIYISYMYGLIVFRRKMVVTFFIMCYFCLIVFISNNIFVIYLAYEASLLPILYIIIK